MDINCKFDLIGVSWVEREQHYILNMNHCCVS